MQGSFGRWDPNIDVNREEDYISPRTHFAYLGTALKDELGSLQIDSLEEYEEVEGNSTTEEGTTLGLISDAVLDSILE
jgi:hypothetical protein